MIGGPLRARVVSHGRILSVGPELGGASAESRAGYGVFTTCCLGGVVMKVKAADRGRPSLIVVAISAF